MARSEIIGKSLVGPCADTSALVGSNVVRRPTGRCSSTEFATIVHGLHQISRRVTIATMSHGFREIGPAVPRCGLGHIRFETFVGIEEQLPKRHRPTLVERKRERVVWRRLTYGRKT